MLRNISLLLLFLMLHHQCLFVQGRHLRSQLCKDCSKHHESTSNVVANSGVDREINDHRVHQEGHSRRVQYEVDDFRPTSPGHSPGVGHSINN
ncbi:hypothetical protein RJT34_30698 [Clitoria ternatea]|uniref:Encoded peptide n=1 Tax=Clitoria ternatea TaxID=43366 RepID=A0AAN9ETW3_CLITE